MANRFTDSRKWDDDWFLELETVYKLLWLYMLDKCNHAGIYKHSQKLEGCCLGSEVDWGKALAVYGARVIPLVDNKFYIPKFIEFQYGDLNPDNRCHASVLSILKKEGAYKGLKRPLQGCKEQDKDKDKDNVFKSFTANIYNKWTIIANQAKLSAITRITPSRTAHLKSRFQNKDFLEKYEEALNKIPKSSFLMGKNDRGWKATFDWFIGNDDRYTWILEGKYESNQTSESIMDRFRKG